MKIKIFSTKGTQKYEHTSEATTWGQLKSEISNLFDLESLTATENITKRDLSVDSAELPKDDRGNYLDFTLFLRPKATKLGAYTYIQAKDILKSASDEVKDWVKIAYATDYTHLTTAQLNEVISRKGLVNGETSSESDSDDENCCYKGEQGELDETYKSLNDRMDISRVISKALTEAGYSNVLFTFEVIKDKPEKDSEKDLEIDKLLKEAEDIFGELD